MNSTDTEGYVYILSVKDIDLPVCKIGMTSRTPDARCAEINKGSTGDFIWEVAHQVAVDDCRKLESIVHKKLEPLRQKNKEFFNIGAESAYRALLSIMETLPDINRVATGNAATVPEQVPKPRAKSKKQERQFRKVDSKYTEILQSFTSLLRIKGTPFGQTNKPLFGMSDGNEGVQWNIAIYTDEEKIRLGINLEGLTYSSWPIATFILAEMDNPSITEMTARLEHPEAVFVRFSRDAWQVTSRPDIVEKFFGGREMCMSEIDSVLWASILAEALGCLDRERGYRGRNKQTVTFTNKPMKGEQVRTLPVSPHLTIWTPIGLAGDTVQNLEKGIAVLRPVHEWVTRASQ